MVAMSGEFRVADAVTFEVGDKAEVWVGEKEVSGVEDEAEIIRSGDEVDVRIGEMRVGDEVWVEDKEVSGVGDEAEMIRSGDEADVRIGEMRVGDEKAAGSGGEETVGVGPGGEAAVGVGNKEVVSVSPRDMMELRVGDEAEIMVEGPSGVDVGWGSRLDDTPSTEE
jgi:hypothetical protein